MVRYLLISIHYFAAILTLIILFSWYYNLLSFSKRSNLLFRWKITWGSLQALFSIVAQPPYLSLTWNMFQYIHADRTMLLLKFYWKDDVCFIWQPHISPRYAFLWFLKFYFILTKNILKPLLWSHLRRCLLCTRYIKVF